MLGGAGLHQFTMLITWTNQFASEATDLKSSSLSSSLFELEYFDANLIVTGVCIHADRAFARQ